ncbi:MAG: hypothetical protein AB7U76_24445 [Pirellulales bacterium]
MQPQTAKEVQPHETVLAYQEAFASPAGRIVLAHLLARFGFTERSTFEPGDMHRTVLHEGQRSVLVHIGRMLAANPDTIEKPAAAENEQPERKAHAEGDW